MPHHPIGPYEHLPAVCGPYDPRAPEIARRVSGMIRERVPGVAVEHVGSTAVPGCAGKGVVDLMIPYREGELPAVKRALGDLSFQHQGSSDPFPEDRPMRVGSLDNDGDAFRLHVHVVPAGSDEPEEFRVFRDRLRSDPGLLRRYVDRKRRIIEGGTMDSVEYAQRKGTSCGRRWTGWAARGRPRGGPHRPFPVARAGLKPAPTDRRGDAGQREPRSSRPARRT